MDAKWEIEPDNKEFTFRGYKCQILRHFSMKTLCGYVYLPLGHPWYGKYYTDPALRDLEVHGGLTFSREKEDSPLWCIGFDCGHSGDYVPGMEFLNQILQIRDISSYRDMDYVRDELLRLVDQIIEKCGE